MTTRRYGPPASDLPLFPPAVARGIKLAGLGLVLLVMVSFLGCTSVPPGYVGIKVNQYGSQKGVNDFPLQTGAVWYFPPTTDVVKFPTFTQRHIYDKDAEGDDDAGDESITYRSSDNASLNADVGITFNLKPEKVAHVYVTFRQDLQALERTIIRDRLRGAFIATAPKYTTMELLGAGQGKHEADVLAVLQKTLEPHGIHIDTVQIVAKPRVDPAIEASITALQKAIQNTRTAEQKVRQVEAEAQQRIAQANGERQERILRAQGEAEANRLLVESINDKVLAQKALDVQLAALSKWDGKMPQTIMGGGQLPFIMPVSK